jgi:hypothetical protein
VGQIRSIEALEAREADKRANARTPDGFDAFWSAYPRKAGKSDALKAYSATLKRASADVLIAGAKRYARERAAAKEKTEADRVKFTKHAATWLNRSAWEDEAEEEDVFLREIDREIPFTTEPESKHAVKKDFMAESFESDDGSFLREIDREIPMPCVQLQAEKRSNVVPIRNEARASMSMSELLYDDATKELLDCEKELIECGEITCQAA